VFNVFCGALAPAPRGIYPPTTMALYPLLFTPTPSPPLFPHPSPFPPLSLPSPLPYHLLLDEATPFNQLGTLVRRILPSSKFQHSYVFLKRKSPFTTIPLSFDAPSSSIHQRISTCYKLGSLGSILSLIVCW